MVQELAVFDLENLCGEWQQCEWQQCSTCPNSCSLIVPLAAVSAVMNF
jgi:hypothetical protein